MQSPPRRAKRIPCAALAVMLLAAALAAGGTRSTFLPPQNPGSPQQLKSMTLEQLGNIQVVTYNKTPSRLLKTPAALYVITSEDILRSGATSIADALRLAPGVEVGRMDSDTWAVGIRGLQNNFSKSVLVLIDGRNVYTPLFAGVYWDVLDLPLEDIDRIEVIRGPGGTIWGPNAGNGVINIITRKASDTQGVSGSALAGTEDHTIDDLQFGSRISKQLTYRFFGRGFQRAHEYHTDRINEDAWHQERVGFRADYAAGRDEFMLKGQAYRGDSPRIVGTAPLDDKVSGGDINMRWERTMKSGAGFYVQAYFDRTLRTNPAFLGESRNTIDFDFLHHFSLSAHQQFSYGGGLRWSPYLTISALPSDGFVPAGGTDHVHTAFVQDEIRIADNFSLTVGTKVQHNNFSGFDLQPSARVLWSPSDRQSLWGGVTRAVTTPSDLEENFHLQGGGPQVFVQVLGNKHFKSEDVIGYEAGYRIQGSKRFYVDLSTFWNEYSRLQSFSAPAISTSDGSTFITITYENQIAGHTNGFEFAPTIAIEPWWRVNMSYSYVSSDFDAHGPTSDISSSGSVNTYQNSSPKHEVVLQSRVDLPCRFQFDQMYRYVSALPAQKVKAYQTADLRLARPLGRDLLLEVVGQNLFQDHHNEWGTGDPNQPPVGIYRAAYIKLSFHRDPKSH
ncbi:MAG TPA: TonB-dependent receptor [Silvibacterium sp.]|nr:TonB-dependent receptor [Silvibacterium sp.]